VIKNSKINISPVVFFVLIFFLSGLIIGQNLSDSVAVSKNQIDTLQTMETPEDLMEADMSASLPRWIIFFFLLIIVVILFVTVGKIGQFRINILERRKDKLEDLVMERTADLLKEKEKVENLLEQSELAKMQLKEANEIKSKRIHIAAHDLKNPLQAIIGFEFLLKEDNCLSEDIRDGMGAIFKSSRKMLNIVSELLTTESSDIHSMRLNKSISNFAGIVDEVILANKIRANQKEQKILTELDRSIYVDVDPIWMIKAIDNILSNAIKYSENGKSIWIDLIKNSCNLILTIRDEGQGISESDKDKLFKKFSRINSIPTDGESSTGLGLYIAKDIIEKHLGEISVESHLKKGAKFTIKLPL